MSRGSESVSTLGVSPIQPQKLGGPIPRVFGEEWDEPAILVFSRSRGSSNSVFLRFFEANEFEVALL
jgi:hypothetical protein